MKKLATLSAFIMGAALLSAAPFSLRLSPERIVSLSLAPPLRRDWSNRAARTRIRGVRVPSKSALIDTRTTDCAFGATWCTPRRG